MHHNRRCYCACELMDTFVRLGFPCWLCPSVLPPFPGFYHCLDRPWLCQPFLSTSEVPGLVDGTHFLCCGARQQSSQARGVCLGCLWHQQVVAGIPVVGWLGQGGQHEPELSPEVCAEYSSRALPHRHHISGSTSGRRHAHSHAGIPLGERSVGETL